MSAAARRYKAPAPPKPPPDTPYALLVRRVWRRLEDRTGMPPVYLDRYRIGAYCPVRCGGTLAVRFVDHADGPEAIIESDDGIGRCSRGCTPHQILEALT